MDAVAASGTFSLGHDFAGYAAKGVQGAIKSAAGSLDVKTRVGSIGGLLTYCVPFALQAFGAYSAYRAAETK